MSPRAIVLFAAAATIVLVGLLPGPALAVAMTRAAAAGYDVATHLSQLARTPPLPRRHAARELHWRLLDACPAAVHSPQEPPPDRRLG